MTAAGQVLGGRYRLLALLATGGMGQVWRARDLLLDRPVAVKVLRSEYTGDPTFRSRFRAEAHHGAGLAHRNIATLHDYGEAVSPDGAEQVAYLVMELVEGEPLSAVLEREGRLDAGRTLHLLQQTAAALAAAHTAGVVHRDIKPGNVLLGDDGIVRITDFGIAWSASSVPLTSTGQVVGTPHYLAPEQAAGERARPAGDVYALGLIGYECLAGRRAFDGDNAVQIALRQIREEPEPLPPDVPGDVRALIGRALRKDPARRFPDGAAFLRAIEDVRAGRPPTPTGADTGAGTGTEPLWLLPGPGEPVPPARTGRLSRLLLPVAALAAGAGIAVTGLLLGGAPAAPPAAAADATQSAVLLVAAEHVGRSVAEVEADLAALGLRVELRPEAGDGVPAGQVTGVSPSGALRPGDLVVVRYAELPPDPTTPAPAPATQAAAPVPASTAAPAPEPPPAPESTPPPAPAPVEQAPVPAEPPPAAAPAGDVAPAAGNGQGDGQGDGQGNGQGDGQAGGHGGGGPQGNGPHGNGPPGHGGDGPSGGGRGKG